MEIDVDFVVIIIIIIIIIINSLKQLRERFFNTHASRVIEQGSVMIIYYFLLLLPLSLHLRPQNAVQSNTVNVFLSYRER